MDITTLYSVYSVSLEGTSSQFLFYSLKLYMSSLSEMLADKGLSCFYPMMTIVLIWC